MDHLYLYTEFPIQIEDSLDKIFFFLKHKKKFLYS